jgi:TusA-related sulfurtransferase
LINSAEEFIRLRLSDNQDEYLRAAWDEAPIGVWLEIIDNYPDMRFWVAQNKMVPSEILEILADDPSDRVRSMVASKNKLSERIQLKMASDSDSSVRMRLAWNKKATHSILTILAEDKDEDIRQKASARFAEKDTL